MSERNGGKVSSVAPALKTLSLFLSIFLFVASILFLATPVFALDALGCNTRSACSVVADTAINSGQVFYYRAFTLDVGSTLSIRPERATVDNPLGKGGSVTIVADEIYIGGTINANGENGGPRFGATSGQNGGAVHLITRRLLDLERSGRITANGGNGAWLGCDLGNGGTGGSIEFALVRGTWVNNESTLSIAGGLASPRPFGCDAATPRGFNGMRGSVVFDFFTPSASNLTILGARVRDVPVVGETTVDAVVRNEFNDVVNANGNLTWSIDNSSVASIVFQNSTRAIVRTLAPGSVTLTASLTRAADVVQSSVVIYAFSRDATNFNIVGDNLRTLVEGGNSTVDLELINELLHSPANGTVEWSVNNPTVLEIVSQNSTAAVVRALSVGSTSLVIRLTKPDGTVVQKSVNFNVVAGISGIMLRGDGRRDLLSGVSDTLTFDAVDALGNPAVVSASTWDSSDSNVVQIVSQNATSAVVRGLKRGTARITATVGSHTDYVTYAVRLGSFDHLAVTPVEIFPPTVTKLSYGETLAEALSPVVVGYDFGNNVVPIPAGELDSIRAIATPESEGALTVLKRVDAAAGIARIRITGGSKPGSATVRISTHTGSVELLFNVTMPVSAVHRVVVKPGAVESLFVGENATFTAVGVDEDGDEAPFVMDWTETNFTGKGLVTRTGSADANFTAISHGLVGVTATIHGTMLSGSAMIAVIDPLRLIRSVKVVPLRPIVVSGSSVDFQAFAVYENATEAPIQPEWHVANLSGSGVIDEFGTFTARRRGNVVVGAKMTIPGVGDLFGGSEVTIINTYESVRSIRVTPNPVTVAAGSVVYFDAVGIDGDGFDVDVAPTWEVTNFTGKAVMLEDGVLKALETGFVFVTVKLPGSTVTTTVNVAIVSGAANHVVISGPVGVLSGQSINLTAKVVDHEGNYVFEIDREPVQFIWSTSSGRIYQNGTFVASRAGSVTITAVVSGHTGISGTKTVIVTSTGDVSSFAIQGDGSEISAGEPYRLSAVWLDKFGDEIGNADSTWSILSGDATISGNMLTGRSLGTVVVQAVARDNSSFNDTATFRVVSGSAASLVIEPTTAEVRVGDEVEFRVVEATDEAGNVFHPTPEDVTWTVSNSNIGSVDRNGFFTSRDVGRVRVTATLGSGFASASITVTEGLRSRSTRFSGRVSVPSTRSAPELPSTPSTLVSSRSGSSGSSGGSSTSSATNSAAPSVSTGLFTAGFGEGDSTLLLMLAFGLLLIGLGAYLLASRG